MPEPTPGETAYVAEPSPTQRAAFELIERTLGCPCEGRPLVPCAYCASLNTLAEAAYSWKENLDHA